MPENVIKVVMAKDKETKNTVRYQEEPDESGVVKVGTLYIQKFAIAQHKLKDKIVVEVRPAETE